jgi:alkane 1-monooxygenase
VAIMNQLHFLMAQPNCFWGRSCKFMVSNTAMPIKYIKYLSPIIFYVLAFVAFQVQEWLCFLPMLFAWIIIPVTELVLPPNTKNMNAAEEEMAKQDRLYDYLLYLFVCMQYVALYFFLKSFSQPNLSAVTLTGRVLSMGLLCGTFGINIGHELGHRIKPAEQWLAKASLLTSLYVHFFIEHNKGHHKNVATPQDPSSARYNEPVYTFYARTIVYSYLSAWHIANTDMQKQQLPVLHWKNEMLQAHLLQAGLVALIWYGFGTSVMLYFLLAALMGILLLETVNYIEHYGLQRLATTPGSYERAQPHHSWNSNHPLGRLMLFELSRHSDHHYMASRKYQILKHHDDVPQLPTGYPGSMLLSLVPPLWFAIMNRRIKAFQKQ